MQKSSRISEKDSKEFFEKIKKKNFKLIVTFFILVRCS